MLDIWLQNLDYATMEMFELNRLTDDGQVSRIDIIQIFYDSGPRSRVTLGLFEAFPKQTDLIAIFP